MNRANNVVILVNMQQVIYYEFFFSSLTPYMITILICCNIAHHGPLSQASEPSLVGLIKELIITHQVRYKETNKENNSLTEEQSLFSMAAFIQYLKEK